MAYVTATPYQLRLSGQPCHRRKAGKYMIVGPGLEGREAAGIDKVFSVR